MYTKQCTITQLSNKMVVICILCLGIIGTKEYRKPEWVTHMEELQAALKGKETDIDVLESHVVVPMPSEEKGRYLQSPDCDLVICSYQEKSTFTPELALSPSSFKTHSLDDPMELYDSLERIDSSMVEYLSSRRHSHSSTRDFRTHHLHLEPHDEKPVSLEIGLEECYLESFYPESRQSDVEIVYIEDDEDDIPDQTIRKDSFCVLSPIEENSEKAETESAENESIYSSSNSNEPRRKHDTRTSKIPKLISHSYDHIPNTYPPPSPCRDECHTLPRAKIPVVHSHKELWNSIRFPTEPRELDPEAYHQLHTADSQEELQEFLLLESECMTDGKNNGLASAFTVSDEGPRIFYKDDSSEDRGTVSGNY